MTSDENVNWCVVLYIQWPITVFTLLLVAEKEKKIKTLAPGRRDRVHEVEPVSNTLIVRNF